MRPDPTATNPHEATERWFFVRGGCRPTCATLSPTTVSRGPTSYREGDRVNARVRGIYATALTQLLRDEDVVIVQPSVSIADRFGLGEEAESPEGYDAALATTDDRLGVSVSGDSGAVSTLREYLSAVDIDAFAWSDDGPREAVFDGVVTATRRGGAVVDLGSREGYLPFDAVANHVEEGDRYRVQVREPSPPWSDDRPLLDTAIRVQGGGLVELVREGDSRAARPESGGGSGLKSSGSNRRRTTGLGDVTDLLPTDVPDEWHARPTKRADDASFDALDAALDDAVTRAGDLDDAIVAAGGPGDPDDDGDGSEAAPRRVWAARETVWVRFGRGSRFALDDARRRVIETMPGHHRIKAGNEDASAAVDFAESVCGSFAGPSSADAGDDGDAGDLDFPFGATTRHFGPREGDIVTIYHGKPDGREIVLGRGEVSGVGSDGTLVLRREMRSAGTYDALGTERRADDVAITRFKEGRWWYQTRYRSANGDPRGTYVNVCTPLELFPDAVRYVDLYVDVVKRPDGEVERVDDAELDAAVADGVVGEELSEKAQSVASAIKNGL